MTPQLDALVHLQRIVRLHEWEIDLAVRPLGLTFRRLQALMAIQNFRYAAMERPSITDIQPMIGMDHSTLGQMLRSMQSDGLIYRRRSVSDMRIILISVTPLGLDKMARGIELAENCALDLKSVEGQDLAVVAKRYVASRDIENAIPSAVPTPQMGIRRAANP